MTAGPLVDLDPETDAREARWPFYVAWAVGGAVLGAVMLAHLPAATARPAAIVPEVTPAITPSITAVPAVDVRRPGASPVIVLPPAIQRR